MRNPRLLDRANAVLLVVDVQDAFRKALNDIDTLAKRINILVKGAHLLEVPVVVTEQYPSGLGTTVAEIKESLGEHELFEKSCFSACGVGDLMDWLAKSGRKQVILTGIEAHVCVSQTAHDLMSSGYDVHLVRDAVDSRIKTNRDVGISKMEGAGAIPTSVEACLFEMLQESGTDTFKAVQKLVK